MQSIRSLFKPTATSVSASRAFSRSCVRRADSDSTSASNEASSSTSTSNTSGSASESTVVEEDTTETAPLNADSSRSGGRGYRAWLNGEGARYRHGIKGKPNWIGDTPFPLNPTFSPLPPLADTIKTKIYNAYTHNHALDSTLTDAIVIRAISSRFGVSMDRIRAIVRLKDLEKQWKDSNQPLQTELLRGMESLLGVKQPQGEWKGIEKEVAENQRLAQRKTVFEMVDVESNDTPVLLPLLKHAQSTNSRSTATKFSPATKSMKAKLVPASRPGRAPTMFADIGETYEGKKLAETYKPNKTKRGNRKRSNPIESDSANPIQQQPI